MNIQLIYVFTNAHHHLGGVHYLLEPGLEGVREAPADGLALRLRLLDQLSEVH